MGRKEDVRNLFNRVELYLDNQLDKDEERNLLTEIKTNPSYIEILGREQSFREFIKTKISRRKVSPALVQTIKEQIQRHK